VRQLPLVNLPQTGRGRGI